MLIRRPFSRLRFSLLLLILVTVPANYSLANDPTPVATVLPIQSTVAETLSLSGSLTAERHAQLSPRVDGLVAEVRVDAGSKVAKGDVLLKQDPAIARQNVAQATAATAEAEATRDEAARLVKEAERLRQQNYISESEMANRKSNLALANAALNAAKAAAEAARENLRRHDLPAPFAGVISAKMTEAGEWVNRGTTVLELVAIDLVRLDVKVPQERFADIHPDTLVNIIPDVYPDRKIKARINAIVPVSDPQARAFLVRVVVDTSDLNLLPGTSATAEFGLNGDTTEKLIVPRDALLLHPDGGYSLFIVNNGIAERRQVRIGQQSQEGVSIINGLNSNEQVVIRGNEVLRDQQAVTIVNQ
jgi:RND family efflux transporter MFP subunit